MAIFGDQCVACCGKIWPSNHATESDRLTSELRHDAVPGWDEPFPHMYGPLNIDAVLQTVQLIRGADGLYAFSEADVPA